MYKLLVIVGAIAYGGAQFGAGSGPIGLTDVECQGSEPALLACPSGGSGNDVCSHSEDAGVACFGGEFSHLLLSTVMHK